MTKSAASALVFKGQNQSSICFFLFWDLLLWGVRVHDCIVPIGPLIKILHYWSRIVIIGERKKKISGPTFDWSTNENLGLGLHISERRV